MSCIHRIATGLILGNSFGTPVTPLFYSNADYMYPMELPFSEDPITNYYINFGMQAVCFIYIIIFYLTNFFIFFLFSVNISYELKFIAQICGKFGAEEEIQVDDVTEETGTLSRDVLEKVQVGLNMVKKETQDKTKIVLKTVVKYHANALS